MIFIFTDSEASNSSPVKSLEKRKTDDQKESPKEGERERGKNLHIEENTSTDNAEKKKSVAPKKNQKGNLKKSVEKGPGKKKKMESKKGTIRKKMEKSSPEEVKKRKAPPKKVGTRERLGTARIEPEKNSQEENSGDESTGQNFSTFTT